VGALGALRLQQEAGPFANSAITSAYDALGRLTNHTSDLGAFTLGYLGQHPQPAVSMR
jgi:hypothetical protein